MLLLVACSLIVGVPTALAQTVTVLPTSAPLPGSQFQGGDGDQDDAPALGLIDWQGLHADGRVGHTTDPQANDDIFKGGSKELEPGGWGLTTEAGGLTPGKDNVLDIYRAVDHPPGGDVFLYLAFTRFAGNGDAFVTFELNQDARLWTNSHGAAIPCRTTGDILISFDDHSNGTGTDVQVDRWVSDSTDAATGCATKGHLESSALKPYVDVEGSFNNDSAINNYLPGFFGAIIPKLQFGEGAINLSAVLRELGDPCAVFGSTWMHSRSSLSVDSDMKDYVPPEAFQVRTCKASPALSSAASGSVNLRARGKQRLRRHRVLARSLSISDTAHLTGGDNPTGTLTFNLYGPDDPTCTTAPVFTSTSTVIGNGYYQSGAFTLTRAGTYRWVVGYSGDDNNQPAGPTACGEATETLVVSPASPTLSSSASGPLQGRAGRAPHNARRVVRVHVARAGQHIYDTADLEGGIAPTGTIAFKLFGPDDPTCSGDGIFPSMVPVHGNGPYNSDPFTPTQAGTYHWVVEYSGDANNHPAGPTGCGVDSETTVISPAHPTISTVASNATVLGNPINDSATLSEGVHPTGTITFDVYSPGDNTCTGTPADSSLATVSGNGTYHSQPFTPTRSGTYRWVASYSGDHSNDAVATSCGDPGEAVVVSSTPPVHPALATTASGGAPAGSPIHDTAHLSGGSDPTGSITFRIYGPDNGTCGGPPADTSSVTVSGNGDYNSAPFTPAAAGTYLWTASYSGDHQNHPAGPTACDDAAESVVVSKAHPTLRTLAFPAVPIGGAVRDRAFLAGGSQPNGEITFRLYGPNDPTCAAPPAFTTRQIVIGNGSYHSSTFAPTQVGRYHWIATYSGDADNNPAATACGDQHEQPLVLPRRPLLSTSSSPPANVHNGRRVRAAGLSIYDAATLRLGFAPTGDITFALFGPDDPTCSGTPIFNSATQVTGNGVYNSNRFTPTTSGTYRWVSTYSGDANNRTAGPTSCGDTAEQVHVTAPAVPQLTTSASDAVTLGGAIHDVAHLSGVVAPTGTITFRLYGSAHSNCSGGALFTSTVNVAGNGDYVSGTFVPTAASTYRWVADYSGDVANNPAGPTACGDSAEIAIVRPPDITPVVPTFSTTASQQPSGGPSLYDTAHLADGIDPSGTITFTLFGPNDQTCSGTPAFTTTVAVTGNGNYRSAAFVVPRPGTYRWVATYSGDALNAAVGPTACGDSTETSSVSSTPHPSPDPGPNAPTPPKPRPKPKPPPPPPQPIVTG